MHSGRSMLNLHWHTFIHPVCMSMKLGSVAAQLGGAALQASAFSNSWQAAAAADHPVNCQACRPGFL